MARSPRQSTLVKDDLDVGDRPILDIIRWSSRHTKFKYRFLNLSIGDGPYRGLGLWWASCLFIGGRYMSHRLPEYARDTLDWFLFMPLRLTSNSMAFPHARNQESLAENRDCAILGYWLSRLIEWSRTQFPNRSLYFSLYTMKRMGWQIGWILT